MSHTARLENDLATLRYLYESNRGQDSAFDTDLLAIIGRCITNLGRCRKSEDTFLTVDELNDVPRTFRNRLVAASGRDDWPDYQYEAPLSRDYDVQLATLFDLRAQLTDACEDDEPSAARIRKIVAAIIRGEIQLWQTAIDAKIYLQKEDTEKEMDAFTGMTIEFSKANISQEDWEKIVDEVIGDEDVRI